MKYFTVFISIIFFAFLVIACNSSSTTNSNEIDTEIFKNNPDINIDVINVDEGYYVDYYRDQNIVIKNESELETLWNNLFQNRNPIPETPSVDFSENMLLFTIRATKPHGGFTTKISKVVKADGVLAVKINNTNPGDGCFTTQALTAPYQIVKIEKLDGPVQFYEKTAVENCET